ncbi:MAG TPA: discoidin domain-containing protein [Telluria sp.]|nr:discoidin domain-containing protein [Telluria sp.]
MMWWRYWLVCAWLACTGAQAQERVLDTFEQAGAWKAVASDGVHAALSAAPGKDGQALCLDFDFGGSAGYASARRKLPLDFGANYEISLWVKAEAPLNNLEFKLVDASGENVWWVNRPNLELASGWQQLRFKKRHVEFAWGPQADHTLRHTEGVELVVSAGRDGGRGTIWFDDLRLRELPPPQPPQTPSLASAGQPVDPGLLNGAAAWNGKAGDALIVDFRQPREFGGVVLHWAAGAHASNYDVALSDDGTNWKTRHAVRGGDGGADPIRLGEAEARYLRVALRDGGRLARLDVKDLAFGATDNAFVQALAQEAAPGRYPRGFSGMQSYWTVLGIDGGTETGLISEDGAIEAARGGFSVEPFVVDGGKLVTWADVTTSHALRDGYLPIPSVQWKAAGWTLTTTAFAQGRPGASRIVARYVLRNTGSAARNLRLALAVRPFQVNPPTQFLNTPPGVSPIAKLAWTGQAFEVNGRPRVLALNVPVKAGASAFDAAALPEVLAGDGWKAERAVEDSTGLAAGAMLYDFHLNAGAEAEVGLVLPLEGIAESADTKDAEEAVAGYWRKRLNGVAIQVPAQGQRVVDVLRSALSQILMTRSGPALMPGTRSYARSWIRDGAMMGEGMLRLGVDGPVRDYALWFAPHQFANGKVPCCVDRRGADPVPENDSQGEFIFLAAQLWRYTHDRVALDALWPRVAAAAAFMDRQLREDGSGLLPASISHEGYSAKPMHSYWDDFWGLRGYRDAAMLARVLGKTADAAQLDARADRFQRDIIASQERTAREHGVSYLSGAAELGDFDPTSTTIALSPGGLQHVLPPKLLNGTFERYWDFFEQRRKGERAWKDYTPYELRNVAAAVRLGWRERAQAMLEFFLADQRPQEWNAFPEVVGRLPREPRFLGDLPHGWVASDYIRSALDMFCYERAQDHALVLAHGVPAGWIDTQGVRVGGLRTPYGALGYSLRRDGSRVLLDIAAGAAPGGFALPAMDPAWVRAATTINGRPARWRNGELFISRAPAHVVIDLGGPTATHH